MLDEAERSLHDALCVLSQTVADARVVYGGGFPEMRMAKVGGPKPLGTPLRGLRTGRTLTRKLKINFFKKNKKKSKEKGKHEAMQALRCAWQRWGHPKKGPPGEELRKDCKSQSERQTLHAIQDGGMCTVIQPSVVHGV